jgi:hypothetical protein
MDAVVQWVRTSWTTRSRGGAAAARRNQAPLGFHLPEASLPFVHSVLMDEADRFEPHQELQPGVPSRSELDLKLVQGRLRVHLVVTPWGMPRRWRRPPAAHLASGDWMRWQVNYRFSWPMARGGAWSYRLDTLNIAHGAVPADIFLSIPPRTVSELAHLR